VLLEAAHIVPYKGMHSHDVQNGICLRVDIHRLFDAHLVSIEPESFEFLVSPELNDETYRAFEGRRLFRSDNAPSRAFLRLHHDLFVARARVYAL
jgi:predicted restriction endonuclease